MSKRTFIWFGILIVVLAVAIPWLAFRSRGDAATGPQEVPASLEHGQEIFQTNCGTCHTLYAAGTDGNYAPDLDELMETYGSIEGEPEQVEQAIETRENVVLEAVEKGRDNATTPGRMPAGILNKEQTEEVAEFVARTAGKG
jgi:mono/diheme cytochrome c family protein